MIQKMQQFMASIIDHAMDVLRNTHCSLKTTLIVETLLIIVATTAVMLFVAYAIGLL